MAKRAIPVEAEEAELPPKRPRIEEDVKVDETPRNGDLRSVKDLESLLEFQQDESISLRISLLKFKKFLENVAEELQNRSSAKAVVLLGFLQSYSSVDASLCKGLVSLLQAWSYTVHVNNDGISAVFPNVMTTLLETISSSIDFHIVGTQICKALLQADNVKLLDKCLNSTRATENSKRSCLKLLCQLVSFDGGACAHQVYKHRFVTLKCLGSFLNTHSTFNGTKLLPGRCIRSYAVLFFLRNLRYQGQEAKSDILSQPTNLRYLLQGVSNDEHEIIHETLSTLMNHVLLDSTLTKAMKAKVLTETTLKYILNLFKYTQGLESGFEKDQEIQRAAREFLLTACTSESHGVLFRQHGWYPPGTEMEVVKVDTGLQSARSSQYVPNVIYENRVPVRNTTLASFVQDLRPWANVHEREITLTIFDGAPELVADYFLRKKAFTFDPKQSPTWIGYATFLFSVLRLPLLTYDMYLKGLVRLPPPVSVVIESILPRPLTKQVLNRCLNQGSRLVRLFAVRILIVALQKLQRVLAAFTSHAAPAPWKKAARELVLVFQQRFPELRFVKAALQTCSKAENVIRSAIAFLISLLYEILPQASLETKYDPSLSLIDALGQVEASSLCSQSPSMTHELQSLLEIASYSFETRWFHKPEKLELSPFTTMLRLLAGESIGRSEAISKLTQSIAEEYYILLHDPGVTSFIALLQSLRAERNWTPSKSLFHFLDNCIRRLTRKTVEYASDLNVLAANAVRDTKVSLLFIAISEQWPFFVSRHEVLGIENTATWIARYLQLAQAMGECEFALRQVHSNILSASEHTRHYPVIRETLAKTLEIPLAQREDVYSASKSSSTVHSALPCSPPEYSLGNLTRALESKLAVPSETEDYPALTRWSKKLVGDAIADFDIGRLLQCLHSQHNEVRCQAIAGLRIFMSKIQALDNSEYRQVSLLVGAVIESFAEEIVRAPLLSIAGALAAQFTLVLHDPLHILFTKANDFLMRSPSWNASKLPTYWIDNILLHPPSCDGAHMAEIEWLLEVLTEGLRTSADINLYRQCSVFERVLSLSASPGISLNCFEKVIHLLYRCCLVGGSTTLVTRCGVLAWCEEKLSTRSSQESLLRSLLLKLQNGLDRERTATWSDGQC